MREDLSVLLGAARRRWAVLGLLALALVVRVPGVFWGANFPIDIFALHNTDEGTHLNLVRDILEPNRARSALPKYPPATAVPVVLTVQLTRAARGLFSGSLPEKHRIVMLGRAFAVIAGTLTVLAVMLLAVRLGAPWVATVASGVAVALAPLHVTQSHFFLADASSILWTILGLWCFGVHLARGQRSELTSFAAAAFCFGASFGIKLAPFCIPSMVVAALLPGPRVRRVVVGMVAAAAGVVVLNGFRFWPRELAFVLQNGVSVPGVVVDHAQSALMYLIHLPGAFGTPALLLGAIGCVLVARARGPGATPALTATQRWLLLWLPLLTALVLVVWRLDPYPRHLLVFLPWVAVFAGLGFVRTSEWLRARRVGSWVLPVVVCAWQAAIVVDEQRHFVDDPRNDAARWMLAHVPAGTDIFWINAPLRSYRNRQIFTRTAQTGERPAYIVMNMSFANSFLSGQGWRNSMPQECRQIFIGASPERMRYMQDLMTGRGGYAIVARFPERYVMPELTVPLRLLGDRWRNFVAEAVILRRDDAWTPPTATTASMAAAPPDQNSCRPGL
jgi:hypothetical protein